MKDLSLPNALRYVFPSMVVFSYLYIVDANLAKRFTDALGIVSTLSFIFLGSVIYLVYRPLLYNTVILWLQDKCRRTTQNYRIYLSNRYKIGRREAMLLFIHIREEYLQSRYSQKMEESASGIHLIYLAGIIAIPFFIWGLTYNDFTLKWLFLIIALICFFGAFLLDKFYEDVELNFLRALDDSELDLFVSKVLGNRLRISSGKKANNGS